MKSRLASLGSRGSKKRRSAKITSWNHSMSIESIVLPRAEWERWDERLRLLDDPPEALLCKKLGNS